MKQNPYYPDSPPGSQDYGPNDNRSRTEINDGGPAFPVHPQCSGQPVGMSLRDWFAGQALMGWLGNSKRLKTMMAEEIPDDVAVEASCKWSYRFADAMIEARDKKP